MELGVKTIVWLIISYVWSKFTEYLAKRDVQPKIRQRTSADQWIAPFAEITFPSAQLYLSNEEGQNLLENWRAFVKGMATRDNNRRFSISR